MTIEFNSLLKKKYFRDVCVVYMKYIHLTFSSSGNYIRRKKTFEEDGDDPFVWRRACESCQMQMFSYSKKRVVSLKKKWSVCGTAHTKVDLPSSFQSVLTLSPGVD